MIAADVSRGKRAARVDAAAASYMLQAALDIITNAG
jgi:RNase H-fold protein (predicted Holliday junction resolvase)